MDKRSKGSQVSVCFIALLACRPVVFYHAHLARPRSFLPPTARVLRTGWAGFASDTVLVLALGAIRAAGGTTPREEHYTTQPETRHHDTCTVVVSHYCQNSAAARRGSAKSESRRMELRAEQPVTGETTGVAETNQKASRVNAQQSKLRRTPSRKTTNGNSRRQNAPELKKGMRPTATAGAAENEKYTREKERET